MTTYSRSNAELLIETYQRDAAWAHRDMIGALEAGRVIDACWYQECTASAAALARRLLLRQVRDHGKSVHFFASTGEAYDATQTTDEIKNGHLLIIESEQVIGLADTWPVAVTVQYGVLHSCAEGYSFRDFPKFSRQQIADAIAEATARGWPLDSNFIKDFQS